jgi:nucleoid-associated protein YgaU
MVTARALGNCCIILAFALALNFTPHAGSVSAESTDTVLNEMTSGGDTFQVLQRIGADQRPLLAITAGTATSRQGFNLQTPCLEKQNAALALPLKVEASSAKSSNGVVVTFAVGSASGDARGVALWLRKINRRWTLCGEWSVDKFNHQELGEKNERQAFAFESASLRRSVSRNNIEGVQTTCPLGCCKIWQTRTLVTEEVETFAINESSGTAERKTFQKWYIAQAGDGLFSIASKVYGNPARLSSLIFFNPQLQKQEKLEDGQKVLVERVPR